MNGRGVEPSIWISVGAVGHSFALSSSSAGKSKKKKGLLGRYHCDTSVGRRVGVGCAGPAGKTSLGAPRAHGLQLECLACIIPSRHRHGGARYLPKHVVLGWSAKPEGSPRGEVMLGWRYGLEQVLSFSPPLHRILHCPFVAQAVAMDPRFFKKRSQWLVQFLPNERNPYVECQWRC